MPRIRVAVLVGLLLSGTAQAQTAGETLQAPTPAAVIPGSPEDAPFIAMARSAESNWRFWVNADYALAGVQGRALPALVTTSAPGTAQNNAGVIGIPGTGVLIGGDPISEATRSM